SVLTVRSRMMTGIFFSHAFFTGAVNGADSFGETISASTLLVMKFCTWETCLPLSCWASVIGSSFSFGYFFMKYFSWMLSWARYGSALLDWLYPTTNSSLSLSFAAGSSVDAHALVPTRLAASARARTPQRTLLACIGVLPPWVVYEAAGRTSRRTVAAALEMRSG